MSPTELSRDRVTEVSLILAPEGHAADGESGILWRIPRRGAPRKSDMSSGRHRPYSSRRFTVPGAWRSRGARGDDRYRISRRGLLTFVPSEPRSDRVLEPDGYFTPRQFETRHLDRCAE
jgi:hypothetical protein